MKTPSTVIKGRGATLNPAARYGATCSEAVTDGWAPDPADPLPARETWLAPEAARTIITRNKSPDVPFEQSINPYRGCEHGCVYCFARPCHSYVDLSPGLDFETRIFYKENAAQLLAAELSRPRYRVRPIAMGTNTDPYQPAEKALGITRQILETLVRFRHPVTIVTKGALIQRDLDLLAQLARRNLVSVMLSVTTLDNDLKRLLEPRTASGAMRLKTVAALAQARVPVGVLVAPVIPAINDHEIEEILERSHAAGARRAAYILLRLPGEVKDLFRDWLAQHYPDRAAHVMSLVRQSRGGRDNDPRFGHRMRGQGVFAQMIRSRFKKRCKDLGLLDTERAALDVHHFRVPDDTGGQLSLL